MQQGPLQWFVEDRLAKYCHSNQAKQPPQQHQTKSKPFLLGPERRRFALFFLSICCFVSVEMAIVYLSGKLKLAIQPINATRDLSLGFLSVETCFQVPRTIKGSWLVMGRSRNNNADISIFGQSYGPVSSPNASDEDANLPINAKVKNKSKKQKKFNC